MAKPNSKWYKLDSAGTLYSALQKEEYSGKKLRDRFPDQVYAPVVYLKPPKSIVQEAKYWSPFGLVLGSAGLDEGVRPIFEGESKGQKSHTSNFSRRRV